MAFPTELLETGPQGVAAGGLLVIDGWTLEFLREATLACWVFQEICDSAQRIETFLQNSVKKKKKKAEDE